jgi:hypothetical protein
VSRQDRLILDNQHRELAHEYQNVGGKPRQYMSDIIAQGLGKPLVFGRAELHLLSIIYIGEKFRRTHKPPYIATQPPL